MSSLGAGDLKERVRQAIDLVDLVSESIALRRQGRIYVGLCPWHDDSRPSLQVNQERQSWKCWVCNIGGDVFSFVMQRDKIGFPDAVRMLAERAGISFVPSGPRRPTAPGDPNDKTTLYRAMAWAVDQLHRALVSAPDAEPARQYLRQRGINEASVNRYRIGYAPPAWQWLLDRARTTEFSPQVLEAVGLVLRSQQGDRYYDRFRGRVVFPIIDPHQRPIGLGGRILPHLASDPATAKYINTPETRLFSKSEHVYGLDVVRESVARSRHVVVMEGYTDVVMTRQHGIDNVVAVLGTALGPRHIQLLRRFADRITLVLDGDEAGQRRTNEVLQLFVANQVDLRIVTLPDQLDPCDFIAQRGAEAFRHLIDTAVDALEYKLALAVRGIDPQRDTHRAAQALEELLATLAVAPRFQDGTTGAYRLREQQVLRRVARTLAADEAVVRARLTELRSKQRPGPPARKDPNAQTPAARLHPAEEQLFQLLLRQPEAAAWVAESLVPDYFLSSCGRDLWQLFPPIIAAGELADFHRLMLQTDDPQLKNLLVQLDEQIQSCPVENAELALRDVLQTLRRRAVQQELNQKQKALETDHLPLDLAKEKLAELVQQRRQLVDPA